MNTEQIIWSYLRNEGLSEYAVAGIMGNLFAESGLQSNILQIIYQSSLGMSSDQYTEAVDNGSYTNFVRDTAGYGLAQWTFWSRKQGLLDLARGMHVSISNLAMQLSYLCTELQEFGLWGKLNACRSVREASNLVLFEYEKPYDTGTSVQDARANWSQTYYDKYAGTQVQPQPVPSQPSQSQPAPIFPPAAGDKYCVVAYRKCNDPAQAQDLLSILQTYAFDGIIVQTLT